MFGHQYQKNMYSAITLTVTVLLLSYNSASAAEPEDWWESATLYQIYPRSFKDSNGDGVGDLNGVTSRLGYLKEIGVTAAWLSPIYESPMADMGYDVANFTNIDPLFGNLEDFDAMIAKAHKLGLKIILDIVPNHSSDECVWFQKSIYREDGYDDFYVWDDGKIDEVTGKRIPPSNWESIFNGSSWTWNEVRQQYYLHQFLAKQPDFNWNNPKVHELFGEIFEFWLKRGVDAFRIDATPYFYEKRFENGTFPDNPPNSVIYTQNQRESIELLYEWREYLDKYQQQFGGDSRIMIGEGYSPIEVLLESIGNGVRDGMQLPMNFNFVGLNSKHTAKDIVRIADWWMSEIWSKHKRANWVTSNHDNPRIATRVGHNKVDMMTMIVHGLPGASVTYNGEEIGMNDGEVDCIHRVCDFRDPERTPMQWDTTKNAGFSSGDTTWLPVNPNYHFLNVQAQRGQARSSLHIFKGMVQLKQTAGFKAFKEDGGFEYTAVSDDIFQIIRTDNATEEYRILANLGNQIEYVTGLSNKTMEYVLLTSYSPHKYGDEVDLSKGIHLMPYEAVVLRWTSSNRKLRKFSHS